MQITWIVSAEQPWASHSGHTTQGAIPCLQTKRYKVTPNCAQLIFSWAEWITYWACTLYTWACCGVPIGSGAIFGMCVFFNKNALTDMRSAAATRPLFFCSMKLQVHVWEWALPRLKMNAVHTQFGLLTVFSGVLSVLNHPRKHLWLKYGGIVWITPKENLTISVDSETKKGWNTEVKHRDKIFFSANWPRKTY